MFETVGDNWPHRRSCFNSFFPWKQFLFWVVLFKFLRPRCCLVWATSNYIMVAEYLWKNISHCFTLLLAHPQATLCFTLFLPLQVAHPQATLCFTLFLPLQVAHPPGYPLFTLMSKAAMLGLHWGSPAWRVNFLCAACSAMAGGTLQMVVLK